MSERRGAIHEYEFQWRAWPKGARIPSHGSVREFGRTEEEAYERVLSRWPAILYLSRGTVIDDG